MTLFNIIYKRGLSALLIPLLLASYVVIPSSTRAEDLESVGVVALLVEESLADNNAAISDTVNGGSLSMKQRVERYARDIQSKLDNTKIVIIPVNPEEDVQKIREALSTLYFTGDGSPNQDTRLDGVVLIGDVPLPLVERDGVTFVSLYPYTDFEDPSFRYDALSDQYNYEGSREHEQPEVWHGVIAYPMRFGHFLEEEGRREELTRIQTEQGVAAYNARLLQYRNEFYASENATLAIYFDKNHSFYEGGEYKNISHQSIYLDLFRETENVSSTAVEGYTTYLKEWENKSYMRYTKEWLAKLQQGVVAGTTVAQDTYGFNDDGSPRSKETYLALIRKQIEENDALSEEAKALELRRIEELEQVQDDNVTTGVPSRIPDIFTRDAIEEILQNALEVFGAESIAVAEYFQNTGRWDYAGESGDYEGQTIYKLIAVLDELSRKRIFTVNNELEEYVDRMLTTAAEESYNLQLDLPVTPINYFGRYTGYFHKKEGWDPADIGAFFNSLGDAVNGLTQQNDWKPGKPLYFDLFPYPSEKILNDGGKYRQVIDTWEFLEKVENDKKYIPYTGQGYTKITHHRLNDEVVKQLYPDNCDTSITSVFLGKQDPCYTWYDNPTPAQEFYIERYDPATDESLSDFDKGVVANYAALKKSIDLFQSLGANDLAALGDELSESDRVLLQAMVDGGVINPVGNTVNLLSLQASKSILQGLYPWLVEDAVILHVVDLPFTAAQCTIYLGGGPETSTYGGKNLPLYLRGFDTSPSGSELWDSEYESDMPTSSWREEKVAAQVTLALAPLEREIKRLQESIRRLADSDADNTEAIRSLNERIREISKQISERRPVEQARFEEYYNVRERDEGRFGAYLTFVERISQTADNAKLVEANRLYDQSQDSLLLTKDDGNIHLDPATTLDPTWFGYEDEFANSRPSSFSFPDFYDQRRHGYLGGCSINNTRKVTDTSIVGVYTHPLRQRVEEQLEELRTLQRNFIEDTTFDIGKFLRVSFAPTAFFEFASMPGNIQEYISGMAVKIEELQETVSELLFDNDYVSSEVKDDVMQESVLTFQKTYQQHGEDMSKVVSDPAVVQSRLKELLLIALRVSNEVNDAYNQEQQKSNADRVRDARTVTVRPSDFGIPGEGRVISVITAEGREEADEQVLGLLLEAYNKVVFDNIRSGEVDSVLVDSSRERVRAMHRLTTTVRNILNGKIKEIQLQRSIEELLPLVGLTCDPSRALSPIYDVAGSISPASNQYIPLRTVRAPVNIKEGNIFPGYTDEEAVMKPPAVEDGSLFKVDELAKRDPELPTANDVTSGSIYTKDPSGRIHYDVVPVGEVEELPYNSEEMLRYGDTSYKACLRYATLGAQQTRQQFYELDDAGRSELEEGFGELGKAAEEEIPNSQFIETAISEDSPFPWMGAILSLGNPIRIFDLITTLQDQELDKIQVFLRKEFPPFGKDTNDPRQRRELYSLYGIRRVNSVIPHKEPTNETIAKQLAAGSTESLPVDSPRYVDFYHYEPVPEYSQYGEVLEWNEYEEHIRIPYLNFFQLLDEGTTFETPARTAMDSYENDIESIKTKIKDVVQGFNNYLVDYVAKTSLNMPAEDTIGREGAVGLSRVALPEEVFNNLLEDSAIVENISENKLDTAYRDLAFSIYWQKLTLAQKYQVVLEHYLTSNPDSRFVPEEYYNGAVGYESGTVIVRGHTDSGSADLSSLSRATDVATTFIVDETRDPEYIPQDQEACDLTYAAYGGNKYGVPIEHWGSAISCWAKNLSTPVTYSSQNEARFEQWLNRSEEQLSNAAKQTVSFGEGLEQWWSDAGEFFNTTENLVVEGVGGGLKEASNFLQDSDGDGLSGVIAPLDTAPLNPDVLGGPDGNGIPDGDDAVANISFIASQGQSTLTVGDGVLATLPLGSSTPMDLKVQLLGEGNIPLRGNNYSYISVSVVEGGDSVIIPTSQLRQRVSDGAITLTVFPKDTPGTVKIRATLLRGENSLSTDATLEVSSKALYASYLHIPCTENSRSSGECARPDITDPVEDTIYLTDEAVHNLTIIVGEEEQSSLAPLNVSGDIEITYYKGQVSETTRYTKLFDAEGSLSVQVEGGVWTGVLPLPRESGLYYVKLTPDWRMGLAPVITSFTVIHSTYTEYGLEILPNIVTPGDDASVNILFKDAEGNRINESLVRATLGIEKDKGVEFSNVSGTTKQQGGLETITFRVGEKSSIDIRTLDEEGGDSTVKEIKVFLAPGEDLQNIDSTETREASLYVYPKGSLLSKAVFADGTTTAQVVALDTAGVQCSLNPRDSLQRAKEIQIQLVDTSGRLVPYNGVMNVEYNDTSMLLDAPDDVLIQQGKGSVVVVPSHQAGTLEVSIVDPRGIIASSNVSMEILPGAPVEVTFHEDTKQKIESGIAFAQDAFEVVRMDAYDACGNIAGKDGMYGAIVLSPDDSKISVEPIETGTLGSVVKNLQIMESSTTYPAFSLEHGSQYFVVKPGSFQGDIHMQVVPMELVSGTFAVSEKVTGDDMQMTAEFIMDEEYVEQLAPNILYTNLLGGAYGDLSSPNPLGATWLRSGKGQAVTTSTLADSRKAALLKILPGGTFELGDIGKTGSVGGIDFEVISKDAEPFTIGINDAITKQSLLKVRYHIEPLAYEDINIEYQGGFTEQSVSELSNGIYILPAAETVVTRERLSTNGRSIIRFVTGEGEQAVLTDSMQVYGRSGEAVEMLLNSPRRDVLDLALRTSGRDVLARILVKLPQQPLVQTNRPLQYDTEEIVLSYAEKNLSSDGGVVGLSPEKEQVLQQVNDIIGNIGPMSSFTFELLATITELASQGTGVYMIPSDNSILQFQRGESEGVSLGDQTLWSLGELKDNIVDDVTYSVETRREDDMLSLYAIAEHRSMRREILEFIPNMKTAAPTFAMNSSKQGYVLQADGDRYVLFGEDGGCELNGVDHAALVILANGDVLTCEGYIVSMSYNDDTRELAYTLQEGQQVTNIRVVLSGETWPIFLGEYNSKHQGHYVTIVNDGYTLEGRTMYNPEGDSLGELFDPKVGYRIIRDSSSTGNSFLFQDSSRNTIARIQSTLWDAPWTTSFGVGEQQRSDVEEGVYVESRNPEVVLAEEGTTIMARYALDSKAIWTFETTTGVFTAQDNAYTHQYTFLDESGYTIESSNAEGVLTRIHLKVNPFYSSYMALSQNVPVPLRSGLYIKEKSRLVTATKIEDGVRFGLGGKEECVISSNGRLEGGSCTENPVEEEGGMLLKKILRAGIEVGRVYYVLDGVSSSHQIIKGVSYVPQVLEDVLYAPFGVLDFKNYAETLDGLQQKLTSSRLYMRTSSDVMDFDLNTTNALGESESYGSLRMVPVLDSGGFSFQNGATAQVLSAGVGIVNDCALRELPSSDQIDLCIVDGHLEVNVSSERIFTVYTTGEYQINSDRYRLVRSLDPSRGMVYSLLDTTVVDGELFDVAVYQLQDLPFRKGAVLKDNGYIAKGIYIDAAEDIVLEDNIVQLCDNGCLDALRVLDTIPTALDGFELVEDNSVVDSPVGHGVFILRREGVVGQDIRITIVPTSGGMTYGEGKDIWIDPLQENINIQYLDSGVKLTTENASFTVDGSQWSADGVRTEIIESKDQELQIAIYDQGAVELGRLYIAPKQAEIKDIIEFEFSSNAPMLYTRHDSEGTTLYFAQEPIMRIDTDGVFKSLSRLGDDITIREVTLDDHSMTRYILGGVQLFETQQQQDVEKHHVKRTTYLQPGNEYTISYHDNTGLAQIKHDDNEINFLPSGYHEGGELIYGYDGDGIFIAQNSQMTTRVSITLDPDSEDSTEDTAQSSDSFFSISEQEREQVLHLVSGHGIVVEYSSRDGLSLNETTYGSSTNNLGALALYDMEAESIKNAGYGMVEHALTSQGEGVGYQGEYTNMLLFAAGNTVGQSALPHMTPATITLGDPVIALDPMESDESTFDKTVGDVVYTHTGGDIASLALFDVDKDGSKDIVYTDNSKEVYYIKNLGGRPARWKYMGPFIGGNSIVKEVLATSGDQAQLLLSESGGGNELVELFREYGDKYTPCSPVDGTANSRDVKTGDLDGDGDDDIALVKENGEIHAILIDQGISCEEESRYDDTLVDTIGMRLNGEGEASQGSQLSLYNTFIRFNSTNTTDPSRQTPILDLINAPRSFPSNPDIVFATGETKVQSQSPSGAIEEELALLQTLLPDQSVQIDQLQKVVARMLVAADLPYIKSGGSAQVRFLEGLATLQQKNPVSLVPRYVAGSEIINGLAARFAPITDVIGSVVSLKSQRYTSEEAQYTGDVGMYTKKYARDLNGEIVQRDDKLLFTIEVHNTLTEDKNIDIADALPGGMSLVEGSLRCVIGEGIVPCAQKQEMLGSLFDVYVENLQINGGQTMVLTYVAEVEEDYNALSLQLIDTSFLQESLRLKQLQSQLFSAFVQNKFFGVEQNAAMVSYLSDAIFLQQQGENIGVLGLPEVAGKKTIAVSPEGVAERGLLTYTKKSNDGYLFDVITKPDAEPAVLQIPLVADLLATFNLEIRIGDITIGKKQAEDVDRTTLAQQQEKLTTLLKETFLSTDRDQDGLVDLWDDDIDASNTVAANTERSVENQRSSTKASFSNSLDGIQKFLKENQCNYGGYCPVPNEWNYAIGAPGEGAIAAIPANFDIPALAYPTPSTVIPVWPPDATYFGAKDVSQFRMYFTPTLTGRFALSACTGPYSLGTFGGIGSVASSIGSEAGVGALSGGVPNCMTFLLPDFLDIKEMCKDLAQGALYAGESLMTMVQTGGYSMSRAMRSGDVSAVGGVEDSGVLGEGQIVLQSDRLEEFDTTSTPWFDAFKEGTIDILGDLSRARGGGHLPARAKIQGAFPAFLMDWLSLQLTEYINKKLTLPTIRLLLPDFSTGVFSPERPDLSKEQRLKTGDLTLGERLEQVTDSLSGKGSIADVNALKATQQQLYSLENACANATKTNCEISSGDAARYLREKTIENLESATLPDMEARALSLATELNGTLSGRPVDERKQVMDIIKNLEQTKDLSALKDTYGRALQQKYVAESSTELGAEKIKVSALQLKIYEANVKAQGKTLSELCKGDPISCSVRNLQYSFDNTLNNPGIDGATLGQKAGVVGAGLNVEQALRKNVTGVEEVVQLIGQIPFVDVRTQNVGFDYPWIPPERISEYIYRFEGAFNDSVRNFHAFYADWKECFVEENVDAMDGTVQPSFRLKTNLRTSTNGNATATNDPTVSGGVKANVYVECVVAAKVAEEGWLGIRGVAQNMQRLKQYAEFHKKLSKYLAWRKYVVGQVSLTVSDIINQLTRYVKDQQQILIGWKNSIRSVKQYADSLQVFIDLFAKYQQQCNSCGLPDRGTKYASALEMLKSLIPLEVIPVTGWPDIELDLTDINLRLVMNIPNIKLRPYEVQLPQITAVSFPRLRGLTPLQLQRYNRFGLNIAMPVLPALPNLPVLPNVPRLQIPKFPDLPPPPKINPLAPRMRVIIRSTAKILEIVCLLNRNIFPVPESGLRSHIEKLTASQIRLRGSNNINTIPQAPNISKLRVATHVRGYTNFDPLTDVVAEAANSWNSWMRKNLGNGALLVALSQAKNSVLDNPTGRTALKYINQYSLQSMVPALNTMIVQGRNKLQKQLQSGAPTGLALPGRVQSDIRDGYAQTLQTQKEVDDLLQQLEEGRVTSEVSEVPTIAELVIPYLVDFQEAALAVGGVEGDEDVIETLQQQLAFLEQDGILPDDIRLPAIEKLRVLAEEQGQTGTTVIAAETVTAQWRAFQTELEDLEGQYDVTLGLSSSLAEATTMDEFALLLDEGGLLDTRISRDYVASVDPAQQDVSKMLEAVFATAVQYEETGVGDQSSGFTITHEQEKVESGLREKYDTPVAMANTVNAISQSVMPLQANPIPQTSVSSSRKVDNQDLTVTGGILLKSPDGSVDVLTNYAGNSMEYDMGALSDEDILDVVYSSGSSVFVKYNKQRALADRKVYTGGDRVKRMDLSELSRSIPGVHGVWMEDVSNNSVTIGWGVPEDRIVTMDPVTYMYEVRIYGTLDDAHHNREYVPYYIHTLATGGVRSAIESRDVIERHWRDAGYDINSSDFRLKAAAAGLPQDQVLFATEENGSLQLELPVELAGQLYVRLQALEPTTQQSSALSPIVFGHVRPGLDDEAPEISVTDGIRQTVVVGSSLSLEGVVRDDSPVHSITVDLDNTSDSNNDGDYTNDPDLSCDTSCVTLESDKGFIYALPISTRTYDETYIGTTMMTIIAEDKYGNRSKTEVAIDAVQPTVFLDNYDADSGVIKGHIIPATGGVTVELLRERGGTIQGVELPYTVVTDEDGHFEVRGIGSVPSVD